MERENFEENNDFFQFACQGHLVNIKSLTSWTYDMHIYNIVQESTL